MNRASICTAYYVYAMLNHGGMWTPEYAVFGRLLKLGFRASPMLRDENDLVDEERWLYDRLVSGESRCMDVSHRRSS